MGRYIAVLAFVLTLLATQLSFAELVPEQWCFKCPAGTNLSLVERDRYECRGPGASQSAGVPLWAKPSWAKVVWDGQEGRCQDGYTRFGDEFCYRCPGGYELSTAVTDYRKQSGKGCKGIIGRWEWVSVPGQGLEFLENNKVKFSDGATGTWQCNDDGSITLIQHPFAGQKRVVTAIIAISHDGSSFSSDFQGVTLDATRVK
jgi:hypothetical protein